MMTDRIIPVLIVIGAVAAWMPWARQNLTGQPVGGAQTDMPMRLEVPQDGSPSAISPDGQRSPCGSPP